MTALDGTLGSLEQLGPAPVDDGEQVATGLRTGLTDVRTAFATARTQVDALDKQDPAEIQRQLPEALAPVARLGNATGPLAGIAGNPQLGAASRSSANCRDLGAVSRGRPRDAGRPGRRWQPTGRRYRAGRRQLTRSGALRSNPASARTWARAAAPPRAHPRTRGAVDVARFPRQTAVAAALLAALFAGGCAATVAGTPSADPAPQPTAGPGADPAAWTDKVCGALVTYWKPMTPGALPDFRQDTTEEAIKKRLSDYLGNGDAWRSTRGSSS